MRKLAVLSAMVFGILAAAPALAQTGSDQYGNGEAVTVTGVLQKQGMTSYQYGTHFIKDAGSGAGYALKSSEVNLDSYAGEEVTVYGTLAMKAGELEGGPALVDVSRVVPTATPPDNGGSTSVEPGGPVGGGGNSGSNSGNSSPGASSSVSSNDGSAGGSGSSSSGGISVLPNTGGLPLSGLAVAGAALLASGFLIRRITR